VILLCHCEQSADDRQIDVDDKGSLDKAAVIAALGQSGDADYDSVSTLHLFLDCPRGRIGWTRHDYRGRRME